MNDESCPLGHGPILAKVKRDLTQERIKENWNKPNPFVNSPRTRLLPETLDFPSYWSDFFDNDINFIKKLMSKRALGPHVHTLQYPCPDSSCEWELTGVGFVYFEKWVHKTIPRYNPNDPETFDWVDENEVNPKVRYISDPKFSEDTPEMLQFKQSHEKHLLYLLAAIYMASSINYGYLDKFLSFDNKFHYDLRSPSLLVNRISFRGQCPGGCRDLYPPYGVITSVFSRVFQITDPISVFNLDIEDLWQPSDTPYLYRNGKFIPDKRTEAPVIQFLSNLVDENDLMLSLKMTSSKTPLNHGHP